MAVYVDTSALIALLDNHDDHHTAARRAQADSTQSGAYLLTPNYVLVEASALIQRRHGMDAVRDFESDFRHLDAA